MSTDRRSFDLRTEPWLPVRTSLGVEQLSLLDTFRRSRDVVDLVGEVPTQTFALVRLLLAILHRCVPDGEPMEVWGELWDDEDLPMDAVEGYLSDVADRFDLLHTTTPFLQVVDLRTAKGEVTGLERLIADVPNGEAFFSTRAGAGITRMTFAEGARWLVHCQAFDPSGIKSGAVGDERVKGGRGYPIGTGWAGGLGGVMVQGANLKETLLLNLVLGQGNNHADAIDTKDPDLPVWERTPLTASVERRKGPVPTGQVDLFTWPSRRLRLAFDDDGVTGVLICNGDPLGPQNMHEQEPMSVWRRSDAQQKKLGRSTPVYMPRAHLPERSMWRGLNALLPQEVASEGAAPAAFHPPGVVEWLRDLQGAGVLSEGYVVRTRALGMQYGNMSSTVTEIIDDALTMHAILIAEEGAGLARMVVDTVDRTDAAVTAYAHLAANLSIAAGGDPEGVRDRAREEGYFLLDSPFRVWLLSLAGTGDPPGEQNRWFERAHRILLGAGERRIEDAGPAAWIGRLNRMGRHVSSPEADAWFRAALRKAVPRTLVTQRAGSTGANG
jgi:CRISPR system Cascade subunit CasA